MGKVKLTKNELKRQKEALARFTRYLPMLQLKKQQLQAEIIRVSGQIEKISGAISELANKVDAWVDVFAEDLPITDWLKIQF